MRWSQLFIPTLRDAPADAESLSHKMLVRGGFIRQLHAGHYSMLPLGWTVHQKVADIVRQEMNAIGCQEFSLPAMHPAWVWEQSGRWETMGDEMFRLTDRKDADLALGMTHEEVFTLLAGELKSYRQMPQRWYQIQTKFRDEPRPKAGLLRGGLREFAMKDSYSFDVSEHGLDEAFDAHHDAYVRIFARLGLPAFGVQASSGAMGGSGSVEFMVPSPAGEDDVARCRSCGYAANVERAVARLADIDDPPAEVLERFPTPGVVTIAALEAFDGGASADRQLKSLLMYLDDELTIVMMRGDHQLNVQKLQDVTGAIHIRPAESEEIFAALGAHPGSLGAVGVDAVPVIADEALRDRREMTTGANEDGWHYRHVDVNRDIAVGRWADLREVSAGEPCTVCGEPLEVIRCVEVGHIFKLGTKYSAAMGTVFADESGETHPIVMGSYGIGVGRAMAAIAETWADDRGLVWPVPVAPFEASVVAITHKDDATVAATERIYAELVAAGIEVVLDDRDVRAGVKFADTELVGIPWRITVGPKGLADGTVELTERATGETRHVDLATAASELRDLVIAARSAVPLGS